MSSLNNGRVYSNLSALERKALKDLLSYEDILIKEADKGSGVMVMDRDRYVNEAFRQLVDREVYRETPTDITQQIAEMVNNIIKKLSGDGYIDDKTLDYLLINSTPRAGRFYLLPKIHKKRCPGRPVISGRGSCTERVSEFVDFHIKLLVPEIPSYIKDTKHFLQVLRDLGRLPEGAIIVTTDVVGLYPHIPNEKGLSAMREALGRLGTSPIPMEDLVDLARIVLTDGGLEGTSFFNIRFATSIFNSRILCLIRVSIFNSRLLFSFRDFYFQFAFPFFSGLVFSIRGFHFQFATSILEPVLFFHATIIPSDACF